MLDPDIILLVVLAIATSLAVAGTLEMVRWVAPHTAQMVGAAADR